MSNLNKRPQRPANVQVGPAPSPALLGEFAQRANAKRDEAATCSTNADAEMQAEKLARADVDQMGEQIRPLLAEVERIRGELDKRLSEADRHRTNAERYGAKARELLNDAAWMDEINARAGRLPAFQPTCCCNPLPGAPDAEQRRAACPIHGTEAGQ